MREAVPKILAAAGVLLLLGSFYVPAEGQPAMVLGTDTTPPQITWDVRVNYVSLGQRSVVEVTQGSEVVIVWYIKEPESTIRQISWKTKPGVTNYIYPNKKEETVASFYSGVQRDETFDTWAYNPYTGRGASCKIVVKPLTYTLTISCNPPQGGTTDPAPNTYTYTAGTRVSVTARANSGYTFTGWTGSVSSSLLTIEVVMDSNKTVTANFQSAGGGGGQPPPQYSVNVSVNGGGSVSRNPNKTSYTWGESVTLTATPNAGWKFDGWSGDAGGNANPLTITVTKNYNITANFSRKDSPSGSFYINGQLVSPSGTLFLNTRKLTFRFVPKPETAGEITSARVEIRGPESLDVPLAKRVDGSWENSWTLGKDGTYTITCKCRWELGDVTIAGISFGGQEEPVPPGYVKIEYVCLPRIGGAIVGCRSPVPKGTHIELEAFPNQGWRFVGWKGDVPMNYTHPKLGFIASEDNMTIIAEFEAIQPVLSTAEAMRVFGGVLIFVGVAMWIAQRRRVPYG